MDMASLERGEDVSLPLEEHEDRCGSWVYLEPQGGTSSSAT